MFKYAVLLGLVSALAHGIFGTHQGENPGFPNEATNVSGIFGTHEEENPGFPNVSTNVSGSLCKDLSGVWQNELGSNMSIVHFPNSTYKITGQYNTSVESSTGAATIVSSIAGLVNPVEGGSLVSINVLWGHGKSLTTWVGQCIVCDDKEFIYTTWVLRSLKSQKDKWMTTLINQDTFWRLDNEQPELPPAVDPVSVNQGILGLWSSNSGDMFNVTFASQAGIIEGDYLTPETPYDIDNQTVPVDLFGSTDGEVNNYTALGLLAAGPNLMRGWTGHIYNPEEPLPILETSWITYRFSDSCHNPRRYVQYGMDNYTQSQPISVHTELAEDLSDLEDRNSSITREL